MYHSPNLDARPTLSVRITLTSNQTPRGFLLSSSYHLFKVLPSPTHPASNNDFPPQPGPRAPCAWRGEGKVRRGPGGTPLTTTRACVKAHRPSGGRPRPLRPSAPPSSPLTRARALSRLCEPPENPAFNAPATPKGPHAQTPISSPLAGPQRLSPLAQRRAAHDIQPCHWLPYRKNLSLSSSLALQGGSFQRGAGNGGPDIRSESKH